MIVAHQFHGLTVDAIYLLHSFGPVQAYHFVSCPHPVLQQVHGQYYIELERGLCGRFTQNTCHTDGLARRRNQLLAHRMFGSEYPPGRLLRQQYLVGLQLQGAFLARIRYQLEEQAVRHHRAHCMAVIVLHHKIFVQQNEPTEHLYRREVQRIAVIGIMVPVFGATQSNSRILFTENGRQESPVGLGHKMIDSILLVDVTHQHKDTTQTQGQSQHIDGGVGPEAQDGTDG